MWWALAQLWERDLLYEGHKVVPYCPRDGTALSSHEVSQGYKDVEDPSVYVRFPVRRAGGRAARGRRAARCGRRRRGRWSPTPRWPSIPELAYVRTADGYVLAEALVERVLGEDAEVADRFHGRDMLGARYEPPFPFIAAEEYGEKGHTVLPADFVTADDGTGIVHTAIAFGEDDFRLGAEHGLNVINPVRPDGTYDERIGPYAGLWVKEADPKLIEDLRVARPPAARRALPALLPALLALRHAAPLLRQAVLVHPHLAAARPAAGRQRHRRPGTRSTSRPGASASGWRTTSTGRSHASATGARRCRSGAARTATPRRSARSPTSRPSRGRRSTTRTAPTSTTSPTRARSAGSEMRRVPEVIDVWFDSGAMPFAQHHAPFENQDKFEARFPADYICEAIDQTRGWFYSLIAISTLLFDQSPYRTVLCLGHIADAEGKKMSKSLGQHHPAVGGHRPPRRRRVPLVLPDLQAAVGRLPVLHRRGRRVAAPVPAAAVEHVRLLRHVRERQRRSRATSPPSRPTTSTRGSLSRLSATVATVTERLDDYDATRGGHALAAFVDDLSNWYVRRSRRRFWDGDAAAFATLRHCLVTVSKLLAPFCPFMADEIYDNLDGSLGSVHLEDWPEAGPRDAALEARDGASCARPSGSGLAARGQSKLKVRQPLRAAVVVAAGEERAAIERLADVALEELNVKELRYVSQADELGSYEVKPNYRALGPRFGKQMPQVAAAVAALDPEHVAAALRDGGRVGISIDGHDHELDADDLLLAMQPLEGYQLEREGSHAVALELELDEDAAPRGPRARDRPRRPEPPARRAGLQVEDRIQLSLGGDEELLAAARAHEDYIAARDAGGVGRLRRRGDGASATIEGRPLSIAVRRA